VKCIVILDWRPLVLAGGTLLITESKATVFQTRRAARAAVEATRAAAVPASVYDRGYYSVVSLDGCGIRYPHTRAG